MTGCVALGTNKSIITSYKRYKVRCMIGCIALKTMFIVNLIRERGDRVFCVFSQKWCKMTRLVYKIKENWVKMRVMGARTVSVFGICFLVVL